MTTLVLDENTEQTTIAELLREAAGQTVEIRDADGKLVATLLMSCEDDDFDYEPYMEEAQRIVDEYRSRPRDSRPPLTTKEFLDSLRRLEAEQ